MKTRIPQPKLALEPKKSVEGQSYNDFIRSHIRQAKYLKAASSQSMEMANPKAITAKSQFDKDKIQSLLMEAEPSVEKKPVGRPRVTFQKVCRNCCEEFEEPHRLVDHVKNRKGNCHHKLDLKLQGGRIACYLCKRGKEYQNLQNLKKHLVAVHQPSEVLRAGLRMDRLALKLSQKDSTKWARRWGRSYDKLAWHNYGWDITSATLVGGEYQRQPRGKGI